MFNAAENASFIITDLNGKDARILEFSPGADRIFGYSREEVVGKPVAILHLKEDVDRFPEVIELMNREKAGFSGESILVRKDGEKFPALFTTYPILDATGKMTATLGVAVDISQLRQTQDSLRLSEDKNRSLFENALDIIYTIDMEGKFLEVNNAFLREGGYQREDIIGHNFAFMVHPDDAAIASLFFEKGKQGQPFEFEMQVKKKDGTYNWYSFFNRPILDNDGNVYALHGIARNITDRIKTEKALKESEGFLKDIFNSIQNGITVLDCDLNIVRVNMWMERMYASKMPLIGKKCHEVY